MTTPPPISDDHDREAEEWITATLTLLPVLRAKFKPGESGDIQCPLCGGLLQVFRARYNGHIAARCHTVGCLSWME